MSNRPSETALQELLDKQQLYENMMLYARGQDRRDLALVKSTYWPDATEHHGLFVGSAHDFCEWTHERQKTTRHHALHHLGNTLSELLGDRAKRETAFMYVQVDADRTKSAVRQISGSVREAGPGVEGAAPGRHLRLGPATPSKRGVPGALQPSADGALRDDLSG